MSGGGWNDFIFGVMDDQNAGVGRKKMSEEGTSKINWITQRTQAGDAKNGRLIFYHHCLCCVERKERNNKSQRLYRRWFYLKTSVSVIAPQKPVLRVLCMHVCIKYLFCPCFAICGAFPRVAPALESCFFLFLLSLFFQHVSILNFDGRESFSIRDHYTSLQRCWMKLKN